MTWNFLFYWLGFDDIPYTTIPFISQLGPLFGFIDCHHYMLEEVMLFLLSSFLYSAVQVEAALGDGWEPDHYDKGQHTLTIMAMMTRQGDLGWDACITSLFSSELLPPLVIMMTS